MIRSAELGMGDLETYVMSNVEVWTFIQAIFSSLILFGLPAGTTFY